MNDNAPKMIKRRPRQLIDRLIRIKKHKSVIFLMLIATLIIGLGSIADSIQKIITLFPQASRNAGEIAQIKERIEAQAETVDLVAKSAAEAKRLTEDLAKTNVLAEKKLEEINNAFSKADVQLASLAKLSEIYNLMLAARSDNRIAFDALFKIANDPNDSRSQTVVRMIAEFPKEIEILNLLEYPVDWNAMGIDPASAGLSDFQRVYETARPEYQTKIIDAVWQADRFAKHDRIAFLIDVLKNTKSLRCLDHVCRILGPESGLNINFLFYHRYIEWWEKQ